MSNEQDPKNVENQPNPAEELDTEALDQVVGGTGPVGGTTLNAPTLPPTNSISFNFNKIEYEYKEQNP